MRNSLLAEWAKGRTLEKTGKVFDGAREHTPAALHEVASKIATGLIRELNSVNNLISVYLPKSVEVITANLGIILSGNYYSNLDVNQPEARLIALLKNTSPAMVLTNQRGKEFLESLGLSLNLKLHDAFIDEPRFDLINEFISRVIDIDPSMVINTSGSTGVPKSVVLTHRNTLDFYDWVTEEFDFFQMKIGSLSPFYFDIYTLELCLLLFNKCDLYIIPEEKAIFPAELIEYCLDKKISFIFWVPTIMVNIVNSEIEINRMASHLQRVFFAGEVFPPKQFNVWKLALPGVEFVNLYGPIEISIDCTFHRVMDVIPEGEKIPIGIPCKNTRVLIVNDDGKEAGLDEVGELWVSGSSTALGYYNNEELTSSKFVTNKLNPLYRETYYLTGDLVSKNRDGLISFHGRRDNQVKHLGYRIELSEIENAMNLHEKIKNSVVTYAANEKEIRLIYESDTELTPRELVVHGKKYLPKYMIPTKFKRISKMPMNPNGKIDRLKLTDVFLSNN